MTLQELYAQIDGDYEQGMRVLRVEKLMDKHIRKFLNNGVMDSLIKAGEAMDANALFETAHAAKGVCANLGLVKLSQAASKVTEEFRPGNSRRLSDAEVKDVLSEIEAMYRKTTEGIRVYTGE